MQIFQRLKDSLPHYGERCLRIRPKSGGELVPFTMNRAQEYVHSRLEEQRARTGKVRALILKGRQQGISTYVGGRFYHRVTHNKGMWCYILTHEQDATDKLFSMVDRYHENCPDLVKPITGNSNSKELSFLKLNSGYAVGTARTTAVGRSQTLQLLHGSEVAFWPNAATHFAGVVQAVPDIPGTEIILESTANGMGGEFHERWEQAERGDGDYITIFVPWFWQEEYQRIAPPDFRPTEEELEYMALHQLSLGRIVWRRAKIAELRDPVLFKQEYPATPVEAFQTVGHDSYIPGELVLRARKRHVEPSGPLVIGYDPAWKGGDRIAVEGARKHEIDRHSMAWRRGRKVIKVESRRGLDTMEAAGWLKHVIDTERPARVFIDVGGVGAGVYDRLKEMGYATKTSQGGKGEIVRAINFGSSPFEPNPVDRDGRPKGGYANRRAEMWGKSKEWLQDIAGVDLPDINSLHADACAPGYKYDSLSRVLLESKDDMRARKLPSPDEWDAVALTFAEPVLPPRMPATGTRGAGDPVAGY